MSADNTKSSGGAWIVVVLVILALLALGSMTGGGSKTDSRPNARTDFAACIEAQRQAERDYMRTHKSYNSRELEQVKSAACSR